MFARRRDVIRQTPSVTASNVTLTPNSGSNIHLYTVGAIRIPQNDRDHRRGRFRQRSGDQRDRAVFRACIAAAGLLGRTRQERGSRWPSLTRRILRQRQRLSQGASPPRERPPPGRFGQGSAQHKASPKREAEQAETDAVSAEADRAAALQALVSLQVPADRPSTTSRRAGPCRASTV